MERPGRRLSWVYNYIFRKFFTIAIKYRRRMDVKHQTEEQEKIMSRVKAGECREVLDQLDKRKIRKFPQSFTNGLLFELLPMQTRPARELAMRLLEYGRCDWKDPDDSEVPLHKAIIRSGRAELAVKAADGLRKRDAEDPSLASVWAELLSWLLSRQQRAAAGVLLKKGILKHMEGEELDEVLGQILSYQDMELINTAVRYVKRIPVKQIPAPESLSDYRFTRELLNRYTKYIEIKDNEKTLWNLSIMCEAEVLAKRLLKKTKDYQYLPRLAEGGDKMFGLLLHIRCGNILDEVKKEVLYGALQSEALKKRFELLAGKGWKKSSVNRKEEICLGDEYLKRLENRKYVPGRKGHLDQINDRAKLRFLRNCEEGIKAH